MMHYLILILSVLSASYSDKADASDFLVKWGLGQYDSRTSTFTQNYCLKGKSPQSVILNLSAEEIETLINSAKEDATSDPSSEEMLCITSGVGTPTLTIFTLTGSKSPNLNLCESEHKFSKALIELVYKSEKVESLDRPNCRGAVRGRT